MVGPSSSGLGLAAAVGAESRGWGCIGGQQAAGAFWRCFYADVEGDGYCLGDGSYNSIVTARGGKASMRSEARKSYSHVYQKSSRGAIVNRMEFRVTCV